MGKIIVSASQLGNLVGFNKHKPLFVAFENVWKRTHPVSYHDALRRNNIVSEDERLQRLGFLQTFDVPQNAWEARKQFASLCKEVGRSGHVEDKGFLKKTMKKLVYTTYGNAAEKALFDHVHVSFYPLVEGVHIMPTEPLFTIAGFQCFLCGRTDALTMDKTHVVELKNRIHRLLCKGGSVPMHEYLQCLTYLYLIPEAKNCHLIECITTKKQRKICHVVEIERDPWLWNTIVLPRLRDVMTLLAMVIRDTALQDAYMQHCRNATSFKSFMHQTIESRQELPEDPR
jgi:hypothetical protein